MSQPKTARVKRRHEQSRQEFVDGARRVLERDGLHALTLEALGTELGVTKPAVYHYFSNKQELLRVLIAADIIELTAAMRAAIDAAPDGAAALCGLVRAFVAFYRERHEAFVLDNLWPQLVGLGAVGFDRRRVAEDVDPHMIACFGALESKLRAGKLPHGTNPRRLAVTAWATAFGITSYASMTSRGAGALHGVDDLVAEACAMLERSLS